MDQLKTIFYLLGTSGSGKSTRVYSLVKFLEDRGNRPTGYLYHNKVAVGREYLKSFYIIGKEINRHGKLAWQGVDSFISEINEGKGSEQLFKFFYETARTQNLVLDCAAVLRSYRSRPLAMESYGVDAKIYLKYYWFEDFKEYQTRIAKRSQGKMLTEDSSMWKSNLDKGRHLEMFREEVLKSKYPERYEGYEGVPSEPIWTIGVDILKRVGQESLVPEFKAYAEKFLVSYEAQTASVSESEGLF